MSARGFVAGNDLPQQLKRSPVVRHMANDPSPFGGRHGPDFLLRADASRPGSRTRTASGRGPEGLADLEMTLNRALPLLSRGRTRVMKEGIHPVYPARELSCACGNMFVTRSTRGDFAVDVCSNCHPFYTGKQKLMDTQGRVDRFRRKYEKNAAPAPSSSGRRTPNCSGGDGAPSQSGASGCAPPRYNAGSHVRHEERPYIGGQAVIEGVMMRSPQLVFDRRPPQIGRARRSRAPHGPARRPLREVTRWPFVRGVVTLVEAVKLGSEALRFSSEIYERDHTDDDARPPAGSKGGALSTLAFAIVALGDCTKPDHAATGASPRAEPDRGA